MLVAPAYTRSEFGCPNCSPIKGGVGGTRVLALLIGGSKNCRFLLVETHVNF